MIKEGDKVVFKSEPSIESVVLEVLNDNKLVCFCHTGVLVMFDGDGLHYQSGAHIQRWVEQWVESRKDELYGYYQLAIPRPLTYDEYMQYHHIIQKDVHDDFWLMTTYKVDPNTAYIVDEYGMLSVKPKDEKHGLAIMFTIPMDKMRLSHYSKTVHALDAISDDELIEELRRRLKKED